MVKYACNTHTDMTEIDDEHFRFRGVRAYSETVIQCQKRSLFYTLIKSGNKTF